MRNWFLVMTGSLVLAGSGFFYDRNHQTPDSSSLTISPEAIKIAITDTARMSSHRISFSNHGSEPISIVGMKVPCSCMTAEVPFNIAPDEVKVIQFNVDGTGYKRAFSDKSTVLFYTNERTMVVGLPIEVNCEVSSKDDDLDKDSVDKFTP